MKRPARPITTTEKVLDMQDYLKYYNYRNYVLFLVGVTTGYRAGDRVKLKVRDIKDAFGLVEESKISLPLRIIQGVCGVAGVLCLSGIMRAWSDITLSQCYQNAPWLFWLCGACLVTWAILLILRVKKQKEEKSIQYLKEKRKIQKT